MPEILKQKLAFRDIAIAAMAMNLLGLASPIFFQLVVDKVLVPKEHVSLLPWILLGLVGASAGRCLLNILIGRTSSVIGTRITKELRERLQRKLIGLSVEYYNRPIGYFERIRQIEETADQILQLAGPLCYLTTSDAYDSALAEAFDEAADQSGSERMAMRSMGPWRCT